MANVRPPSVLKKGDLFLGYGGNGKQRLLVVILVKETVSYCIPLTTTEDAHTSIKHQSRFIKEGFYCNHTTIINNTHIYSNFIGVIDDNRNLNKAIKIIKDKLRKDLKI